MRSSSRARRACQVLSQVEEPACPMNIFRDLRAQRLYIRPFHLCAQPFKEPSVDLRLSGYLDLMEVEQVAFNGKRVFAERWAIADIGYGIERLPGQRCSRDVHAVRGDHFVISSEIHGGYSVL